MKRLLDFILFRRLAVRPIRGTHPDEWESKMVSRFWFMPPGYRWLVALVAVLIPATAIAGNCNQFFRSGVHYAPVRYVSPIKQQVFYSVGQQTQDSALISKLVEAYKRGLSDGHDLANTQAVSASQTMIKKKCGKCHGGSLASPKGETFILSEGNSALTITAALRQIRDDKMPPGKPLSNEEKASIMQELLESEK